MKVSSNDMVEVFARYITRNGKRIYPKNAAILSLLCEEKVSGKERTQL